ncbi:MAG: carboxypeptidase M32 [Clostridiaceae bacterium]|nr:carboxypeptidase M32 [Clostridiaceae bacterium]
MDYREAKTSLRAMENKLYALSYAQNAIYLDAVTVAPCDTAEGRGRAVGELSAWDYSLFVTDETRGLLQFLLSCPDTEPIIRREAQALDRRLSWMNSIPKDEYAAFTVLTNDAEHVWHKAKATNDFALFRPYLEQIVESSRRFAGYFDPSKPAYDVLLDHYERGLSIAYLDPFFASLRADIVPLLGEVTARPAPDDTFLYRDYPVEDQRAMTSLLLGVMGISPEHCAVAETEHPFQLTFDRKNVRIATHYYRNNIASSIYSALHEGGHALYELGYDEQYEYTSLSGGASMAIHESQSRFYENIIGRSEPFVEFFYPKLADLFPSQLAGVTPHDFFRAVNRARPSLIRTEADELTYSLHICVRYELEKRLLDGTLAVRDVPEAWNTLYRDYLGVDVPDDTRGCLQDSHWSGGMLGYFPSYALGSAYGAQMLAVMRRDIDVDALSARDDLTPITAWLRDRIHRHACFYEPLELFGNAVGVFDPKYYVDYLKQKFLSL